MRGLTRLIIMFEYAIIPGIDSIVTREVCSKKYSRLAEMRIFADTRIDSSRMRIWNVAALAARYRGYSDDSVSIIALRAFLPR